MLLHNDSVYYSVYSYFCGTTFKRAPEHRVCKKKKIIQSSRKYIKHNKLASHTLTHGTAMALHKNERNGLRGVGSTNEYFFFSCFMIMTHEIPYRQTHKLTATRPYYGDHKRFSPHILCVCVCARHGFVLFAIFILNPRLLCAFGSFAIGQCCMGTAAAMPRAPKFMRCVQQKW